MNDDSLTTAKATIESSIAEGQAHLNRIAHATDRLKSRFPLTEERLSALSDDETALLDQFIYRFIKLQDSMATRFLPSLDAVLRLDTAPRPFLDILSNLEQLRAIPSEEDWLYFRALRNNLAHDYPESRKQTVTTLNALFEHWSRLSEIFETARDYYRQVQH